MLKLEKYRGPSTRHTCPNCGAKKQFSRYIDTETGEYISNDVGRCNRESSCGYHLKPKEHFASHPSNRTFVTQRRGKNNRNANNNRSQSGYSTANGKVQMIDRRIARERASYIEAAYLLRSLGAERYRKNGLVNFLLDLFPNDSDDVIEAIADYMIGTGKNGETIFWQVDSKCRVRTGKLIAYDPATGKRVRSRHPSWVHSTLQYTGRLPNEFELMQCFFGEHLLNRHPDKPIAIVESEKTALIAHICRSMFPAVIWIACGGKSMLNEQRVARIAEHRRVVLFPDADAIERWNEVASTCRRMGMDVRIAGLFETNLSELEISNGFDLADYLISAQQMINRANIKIAKIRATPHLEERFELIKITKINDLITTGRLSVARATQYAETEEFVISIVDQLVDD